MGRRGSKRHPRASPPFRSATTTDVLAISLSARTSTSGTTCQAWPNGYRQSAPTTKRLRGSGSAAIPMAAAIPHGSRSGHLRIRSFETVPRTSTGTINGIAESRSTALLAVGAASAAMNSSDVSYTLEPFSSLGPTAAGITKPDVVGVDRHPSTILATQEVATQVAEGTPISSASSDVRWPGTSQAVPTATQAPVATATPDPDSTATPVTETYDCGPIDDGASTRDEQQSEANTGYERLGPGALQGVLSYEKAVAENRWRPEHDYDEIPFHIEYMGDTSVLLSFLDEREISYWNWSQKGFVRAFPPLSVVKQISNLPGVTLVYIGLGGKPASNVPSSDDNGGSIEGSVAAAVAATPTFVPEVFLHGADEWRETTYDGDGIKVGIIDSGLMSIDHLMDEELM